MSIVNNIDFITILTIDLLIEEEENDIRGAWSIVDTCLLVF